MGTFNLAYLETTLLVWGITTKDGLCTGYRLPVTTVVIEKCTYKVYIYFNMIDLVIVQFESLLYREEEITNRLAALVVQNAYFVFAWYRREFLTTLYLNPVRQTSVPFTLFSGKRVKLD